MRDLGSKELQEIEAVAHRAAAAYARKVFWANIGDLRSEAYLAAFESVRRWWDPTTGVPMGAYAWRACVLHLRKWCWRTGAPVHASDHNVDKLRGLHRKSIDAPIGRTLERNGKQYRETMADTLQDYEAQGVEDLLDEKRWTEGVREQVDFLLDEKGTEMKEIALRTIRDGEKPQAVASAMGLPVNRVYRLARRARVLLADNKMLFDYWRSR